MRERKIIRLQGYDYSNPGYYFITMCVHNRENIFGSITDNELILNKYGTIAKNCWFELPEHFPFCEIDEFVVMLDHVHGIIKIVGDINIVGDRHSYPLQENIKPQYKKLPVIIGSYKSAVTKLIHQSGRCDFKWQRSFHDRIIRNENEFNRIKKYIKNNPKKLLDSTSISWG